VIASNGRNYMRFRRLYGTVHYEGFVTGSGGHDIEPMPVVASNQNYRSGFGGGLAALVAAHRIGFRAGALLLPAVVRRGWVVLDRLSVASDPRSRCHFPLLLSPAV